MKVSSTGTYSFIWQIVIPRLTPPYHILLLPIYFDPQAKSHVRGHVCTSTYLTPVYFKQSHTISQVIQADKQIISSGILFFFQGMHHAANYW